MATPTLGTAQTAVASASTSSLTCSITPPANTTNLLIGIGLCDTGSGVPTLTNPLFGGSVVPQYGISTRGTVDRVYCFYVFNPSTSAQTFSATKSSNGFWIVTAVPVFGSETSSEAAAFGTLATANGLAGTSPSVAAASATGELMFDLASSRWQDTDTVTPGAGQTVIANTATTQTGVNSLRSYCSSEAGASSVTMSWTKAVGNAGWAQLAFSLKGTAAIGGPATWVPGSRVNILNQAAINRASRW